MRILLFDNYDSFTYNLLHLLEAVDERVHVEVIKNDDAAYVRWEEFDKLVLSPGPGLPDESGHLMALIHAAAGKIPIFGVCLGLQALCVHFGGALRNLSEVAHGVARQTLRTDPQEPVFKGIGDTFMAGRYHSWVVAPGSLPGCLRPVAVDTDGNIMAIRHTEWDIFAVQFHPESVLTPDGRKMIENWVKS